ncbi:hypothetical protein [uncultured Tateyamaria sp.]|uniref:hypothetical protein n=1 Tax=uncultured Tateyamaria sp. TaxID=455651 RepID=UPI00262032BA|nr:hypothetical protein [uncultured Tateyamaria sp.]
MRFFIVFLLPTLAHAWTFTPSPICTLDHIEPGVEVKLTYDHATKTYAITLTSDQGWPQAPAFSMAFTGPRPNTISTPRHQTQGNTLTVTDSGFGNVLDGLQHNETATAFTATAAVTVSLKDAAEPVQRFRDCTQTPIA